MIKAIFSKTRAGIMLCFFSLIIFVSCGLYWARLHQEIVSLQRRLTSLNSSALRSQEASILFKVHPKDFEGFELCAFETAHTPETIRRSLSYPIEFGSLSSLNKKDFVSQDVSFSISSLQDRDIFAFIDQLMSQGPGIFHIHDVSITRLHPLTEEMVEKVAAGISLALFDGKVIATWIHR